VPAAAFGEAEISAKFAPPPLSQKRHSAPLCGQLSEQEHLPPV
jgi:hypothetical protein